MTDTRHSEQPDMDAIRKRLAGLCDDQADDCDRIAARYGTMPQGRRAVDEAADWRKIAAISQMERVR